MRFYTEIMNLPYFDEVLNTRISCDHCNYKYSDLLITSQNKPMEHKYTITCKDDLNVRIIRSTSATIEIPELGITIEPASASEAFISNIEGILVRASSVVEQAGKFAEDPKKEERAKMILKKIAQLRKGNGKATIIIKDPLGNSGILSDKTKTRELSAEEVNALETGMTIIDQKDIQSKKK